MITKEKALDALAWLETYDSEGHCGSHAVTLRQYIEETADLRRQLDGFESVLLLTRKALCGDINNQDDIVDMASDLRSQLAEAQEEIGPLRTRLVEKMDDCVKAEKQLAAAQEEIAVSDKLLAERERVLSAIPECPIHGKGCVINALAWVEHAQARLAELEGQEPVAWKVLITKDDPQDTDKQIREWVISTNKEFAETCLRSIPLYANHATSPADQNDAARYRWLRDAPATHQDDKGIRQWLFSRPGGAQTIDAAIDAAMLAASPGGREVQNTLVVTALRNIVCNSSL